MARRPHVPSRFPRRQFIWQAPLFAAIGPQVLSSACRTLVDSKISSESTGEVYDCIILGAGIAGLAAAWQLQAWFQSQNRRVLMLEGSDRIGGRLYTKTSAFGRPVEMGAEFIHRSPSSGVSLWNYVNNFGLPYKTIPKNAKSLIFYPPRPLFRNGLRPAAAALLWNGLEAAMMFRKIDNYGGPDMAARRWVEQYQVPFNLDRGLGEDFVSMALTGHMPGTMDDLSIRGFAADKISIQLNEPEEYCLTGGYGRLAQAFAHNLKIELNTEVEKISYSFDGVTINTSGGRTYRAKSAVCTFSAGMLRNGGITFAPALPAEKTDALRAIKLGHHSKIIMPFASKFWPDDMSMAHLPWRGRHAGRTYFHLYYGEANAPAVLSALYMSEDAMWLDRLSLEEALREICRDLDTMFKRSLRLHHGAHVSSFDLLKRDSSGKLMAERQIWMDDKFAKGGNSYLSTDPTQFTPVGEARAALARSSSTPGLFWAGEATALTTQPASIHGATESALRVAREVYEFLHQA